MRRNEGRTGVVKERKEVNGRTGGAIKTPNDKHMKAGCRARVSGALNLRDSAQYAFYTGAM